jgi:predicted dehydrogenase
MKHFALAVVGCGNISRMHFDAYLPQPERVRVVAACDIDPERVHEARRTYGFAQGFGSLEEMIAQSQWEVAVVCTPTPVRRQVVDMLASAGKHVFVEKPFADTYQDALHMVEVCEQAGVKLAVNQNFRFHYPFEMARDIVAQGEIGRVVSVLHQDLLFRQDVGWRTRAKRHALAVMGIHWFDGFRRLLHDEAASLVGETRSSAAIECAGETEASIQITFTQGALVTYVESFSAPRAKTETVVCGETGQLVLSYEGLSVFDRDHRSMPRRQYENPYRDSHKPEATFTGLDLLLAAVEQGNEPANSGRDNLKTVALLDGAYRSAEQRHAVVFHEGIPL